MRRTGKKLIWKWYVISTRSYLYISFCNLKRKLFTKGKILSNWRECVAHYYYQLEGIYVKWWTGLHNFFDGCSRQSSSQFGSEVFPPFGRIWYSTRLYSMQCAASPTMRQKISISYKPQDFNLCLYVRKIQVLFWIKKN